MNKTIKWLFNEDDNWFISGVSVFIIAFLIMIVLGSNNAFAHQGRVFDSGCHWSKNMTKYHCHYEKAKK